MLNADFYDRAMLGFTTESYFRLYLPVGNEKSSSLNIVVRIRDNIGGVTEYILPPVVVIADLSAVNMLIDCVQNSHITENNNMFMRLLASRTQNTVAQTVTTLSQLLNTMNNENIQEAISSMMFKNKNGFSFFF